MIFNADTLDYVWKSIVTISVMSTVIMFVALVIYHFVKNRIQNAKMKLFFNLHSVLLLLSIGLGSLILIHADPELASACFSHFAKQNNSMNITRLLAGTYLSIVLVMLSFDFIRTFVAYKKIHSLKKVDGADSKIILNGLINKLKLKQSTSLYASSEIESPFVWGLFNHRIVITESLLKASNKKKLEAVLSHEAIHVRDNDSLWLLMSHFVKRILFFHPLAYLFSSKHQIITEITADELAVYKCGIQKGQLLTTLIEIAEQCTGRRSDMLQAHASKGFHELSERIRAMANGRRYKMNWLFSAIATASLISCSLVAVAQARASIAIPSNFARSGEFMCSQVKHEKIIEVWLSIQTLPSKNKCELN